MNQKYPLPDCLNGQCTFDAYRYWLARKAKAHRNRDRKRGNEECTIEAYKIAIHQAVVASDGVDSYTGRPLRWDLISQYDNDQSKAGKRKYKAQFGDLPTVDHIGDGLGAADFRICAWRTNDAKNDLTYEQFLELCRWVIAHSKARSPELD
jgi:hypothetical protein